MLPKMKLFNYAFALISLLNSVVFCSPIADPAPVLPSVDASEVIAEIVSILTVQSLAPSCCAFFETSCPVVETKTVTSFSTKVFTHTVDAQTTEGLTQYFFATAVQTLTTTTTTATIVDTIATIFDGTAIVDTITIITTISYDPALIFWIPGGFRGLHSLSSRSYLSVTTITEPVVNITNMITSTTATDLTIFTAGPSVTSFTTVTTFEMMAATTAVSTALATEAQATATNWFGCGVCGGYTDHELLGEGLPAIDKADCEFTCNGEIEFSNCNAYAMQFVSTSPTCWVYRAHMTDIAPYIPAGSLPYGCDYMSMIANFEVLGDWPAFVHKGNMGATVISKACEKRWICEII